MKNIEEKVKEYLDQKPAQNLSEEELHKMMDEVYDKKQPQKTKWLVFWQRFAIACCCILVILPCVLVPVLLKPQDEPYYGEDEVTKTELSLEYAQDFIQQNFAQYSFIFEDCTINSCTGINEINSNKLVAISIYMKKNSAPRTTLDFNLIIDNKYKFAQDDKYTKNAEITKFENYTLYRKDIEDLFNVEIFAMLDYVSYKLYLNFSLPDEEFLEKFL